MIVRHIQSLARFYLFSPRVELKSAFAYELSVERLTNLSSECSVRTHVSKRGAVTAVCSHHSARTNVMCAFEGTIEEKDGMVTLRGRLGIDPGIRCVLLLLFVAMFVVIPLRLFFVGDPNPLGWKTSGGMLGLMGILELGYLMGINDDAKIFAHLKRALVTDES